jgi:hypothetical protein
LSTTSGVTRDFENSRTSVRVGKKYITLSPDRQAWRLRRMAHVVPPTWLALESTTCGEVSS